MHVRVYPLKDDVLHGRVSQALGYVGQLRVRCDAFYQLVQVKVFVVHAYIVRQEGSRSGRYGMKVDVSIGATIRTEPDFQRLSKTGKTWRTRTVTGMQVAEVGSPDCWVVAPTEEAAIEKFVLLKSEESGLAPEDIELCVLNRFRPC